MGVDKFGLHGALLRIGLLVDLSLGREQVDFQSIILTM